MIRDPEILSMLEEIADRTGMTKAKALESALRALKADTPTPGTDQMLFPRDRVTYRTYSL